MNTEVNNTHTKEKTRGASRASHQPTGEYEVGYCRPPKHGQFQKGCSGHTRKKRKRSTNNLLSLFKRVAAEPVTVRIGGMPQVVSRGAAALYAIHAKGIEGHGSAVNGFLLLAQTANQLVSPADREQLGGFMLVSPTMTPEEWAAKYGTRILTEEESDATR